MLRCNVLKNILSRKPRTRRRTSGHFMGLQDLEPRLFLSVNSVLSTDSQSTETSDSSSSTDSSYADSPVAPDGPASSAASESTESGYGSDDGTASWADNPQFISVYMSENEFGIFVAGSVEWEDYPFSIENIPVEFYDDDGTLVGMAYTDSEGLFALYNVSHFELTVVLINPNTFETADITVVMY